MQKDIVVIFIVAAVGVACNVVGDFRLIAIVVVRDILELDVVMKSMETVRGPLATEAGRTVSSEEIEEHAGTQDDDGNDDNVGRCREATTPATPTTLAA